MNTTTTALEALIQALSPSLRAEVRDFVEFLLTKHNRQASPLRQDWAEALKNDHAHESSVDLQHQALDWRTK
jgi:hypothetical protein